MAAMSEELEVEHFHDYTVATAWEKWVLRHFPRRSALSEQPSQRADAVAGPQTGLQVHSFPGALPALLEPHR